MTLTHILWLNSQGFANTGRAFPIFGEVLPELAAKLIASKPESDTHSALWAGSDAPEWAVIALDSAGWDEAGTDQEVEAAVLQELGMSAYLPTVPRRGRGDVAPEGARTRSPKLTDEEWRAVKAFIKTLRAIK